MVNAGDLKSPDLYGLAGSSPAPGTFANNKEKMKTKLSELTPKELKAVLEHELLHRLHRPDIPSLVFGEPMDTQNINDILAELDEAKAKGLDFDENGEVIEDFSYLESFES